MFLLTLNLESRKPEPLDSFDDFLLTPHFCKILISHGLTCKILQISKLRGDRSYSHALSQARFVNGTPPPRNESGPGLFSRDCRRGERVTLRTLLI